MKMYIVAAVTGILYLGLYLLARRESPGDVAWYMRPFGKMSKWVCRSLEARHIEGFPDGGTAQALERLYPGRGRKELVREHWEKKISLSLALLLAGTVLGLLVSMRAGGLHASETESGIVRGDYRSPPREIELEGSVGKTSRRYSIEIESRRLTGEERDALFEDFARELPGLILGGNTALDQVTENLNLQEIYPDYPFSISWRSEHPEIVSQLGTVNVAEEAQWVQLTATVSYEEWEKELPVRVRVTEPALTEEEQAYRELGELLRDSEQSSRDNDRWILPTVWGEEEVEWRLVTEDNGLLLWGVALCVAVLLFPFADKDVSDSLEKRKQSLQHDYPEIVHKLALYMGAGMTIRGSFNKLAGDYTQSRKEGRREQLVYEEILFTCRELQTGVSESAAYEHFGRRCGVQEYIRLSTLLAQNLKKGNRTLLLRLSEETERANGEHLQYARKKGEEAQTKLLLPMVMMLLVVMLLLILPAFWSVQ